MFISFTLGCSFTSVYKFKTTKPGSGASGSWWAMKELTNDRCYMVCETECAHGALKFLIANVQSGMCLCHYQVISFVFAAKKFKQLCF